MRHWAFMLFVFPAFADVTGCQCDPSRPETLAARECSLCKEAEKHQENTPVFFLKDINPRKPNRWLALPKNHGQGPHALSAMTPAERLAFWTAAIGKAQELWGEAWGLALNGNNTRTQCHAHVHVGRLIEGLETDNVIVVDGPAQIPVPEDGSGLWIHPFGRKLHVHLKEQLTETVLLR